jgi:hypothetical protein
MRIISTLLIWTTLLIAPSHPSMLIALSHPSQQQAPSPSGDGPVDPDNPDNPCCGGDPWEPF